MKATLKIEHIGGAEEFVDYEFSEEQTRILRAFCEDAWKLRTSAIFGEKATNKFTLNWSQENGVTFVGDPIDDEAWAAGMHRLRPLLLSDEPSSFYNVASLIGKQIKNSWVNARLKQLRMKFRGDLMPVQLTWFVDGGQRSVEEIFDMWLNAFEHHRDREKQDFFSKASTIASDHQMRHFINMHASEKLRAIMGLFGLIIEVCGDELKPQGLLELEKKKRAHRTANAGAHNA